MICPDTPHRTRNLDQAAQAYDQRYIPMAIGRYLVVVGMSLMAVGLAPPFDIDFIESGLGPFILGLLLPLPFRQPRTRWIALVGGGFIMLYAFMSLANAAFILMPSAKITSVSIVFGMSKEFNQALALLNEQYDTPSWMIARSITALLAGLVAIELFPAGWFLARLSHADGQLLVERSKGIFTPVLAWLLDFPPGFITYHRRALGWLFVAMFGMFCFITSSGNIAGASGTHNLLANAHVADCSLKKENIPECIDQLGAIAAAGMVFLAFVSFLLLPVIGSWLIRLAQRKAAKNAAKLLEGRQQAPLLFLRSFKDDQVELPPPRWTPMRYALTTRFHLKPPLDHLLLGEFMHIGLPLALGLPSEKNGGFPPFGAIRIYADEHPEGTPEEKTDWFKKIQSYAKSAARIVLVFDESITDPSNKGLRLELEYLGKEPDLLAKTVFLAHPKLGQIRKGETTDELLGRNHAVWAEAGRIAGFAVPKESTPLLSLAISADGIATTTSATRFSATTVLLALRAVFFEQGR